MYVRKVLVSVSTIIILILKPLVCNAFADTSFLYVAKNGNDMGNGTITKPLATLEAARSILRQRHQTSPSTPTIVYIRKGNYYFSKTFELSVLDSVGKNGSVCFRAYAKEPVAINGGVAVDKANMRLVSDKSILGRLPEVSRGKVYRIPLFDLGIKNFGSIHSGGFRRPYYPSALEVFIDKKPLHLARYPNDTNLLIKKVIDPNGTFGYEGDRPARWTKADQAWIGGSFCWAWADDALPLASIDIQKKTITSKERSMFDFSTGEDYRRWYVFNLLEELDTPGEYFVDRPNGILYLYPPLGSGSLIEISLLETPLISIKAASNITFEDITFENTRGMGVYMEEGNNDLVKNCTFRNIGMVAVVIGQGIKPFEKYIHNGTGVPASAILGSWHEHLFDNPDFDRKAGKNNGIEHCKIYNAGWGGVSLGGGNRIALDAASNFVKDCEIFDINRWAKTYRGAVNIDGVGNIVRGNHLHATKQLAIYMHGNNHKIDHNEIDHACQEAEDMGAVYMVRDPSEAGHEINYNYFHDILPAKPAYRLAGIYFDEGSSTHTVQGNVFYKVGNAEFGAVFVHGGRDILIKNNIFIACAKAIGDAHWDEKTWNENLRSGVWQTRLYGKINVESAPYAQRYPGLSSNLKKAKGTCTAINNIAYLCKEFSPPYYSNIQNFVTDKDPGFVGFIKKDFNLKKAAPALSAIPSFTLLPFDQMGTAAQNAGNPFDQFDKNF